MPRATTVGGLLAILEEVGDKQAELYWPVEVKTAPPRGEGRRRIMVAAVLYHDQTVPIGPDPED